MTQEKIEFYDWAPSPFCLKIRAILDYKRLAYRRINPLGPALMAIYRRGRIGKVPALEIGGELFVDSTDIAYELERRFPEPAVIPTMARQRALCHAIEDWSDESLYFVGLYYQWYEARGRQMVPQAFGKSLLSRLAYRAYLRRILGQLRGQGVLRKPPGYVRSDLDRHLDAIEALLDPGPYLLGDSPYLCDFALFGQITYLSRTPFGGEAMEGRPSIERFRARMNELRQSRTG